eukprot:Opistho-2@63761
MARRVLFTFLCAACFCNRVHRVYYMDGCMLAQAGNPFPDAMFAPCGANGNDAENTHWTPFLKAAAEYVHETYPQPWDEATEKLVVFLLGLVSHQVADISWHSLGIDQGLLTSMGGTNFHGDGLGRAQAVGDRLDDAIVHFDMEMGYDQTVGHWYLPLHDLVPIYRKMDNNTDVTIGTLLKCTSLLFLGRFGEKLALSNIYLDTSEGALAGFEERRSPFLADNFVSYFLDGVDDMAQWTANVWDAVIEVVEHGTEGCDLPNNPLYVRCGNSSATNARLPPMSGRAPAKAEEIRRHYETRFAMAAPFMGKAEGLVTAEPHLRGVRLSVDMEAFSSLMPSKRTPVEAQAAADTPDAPTPMNAPPLGNYARLGASVAAGDFNGDGTPDLAVGSPGSGTPGDAHTGSVLVTVSPAAEGIAQATLSGPQTMTLEGLIPFGRFGESLCTCDINGDGIDDLAVGAPSAFSETLSYRGALYVYYGRKGSAPVFSSPDMIIEAEGPDGSLSSLSNFGFRLTSGDLDSDGHADLIVSSPYANYNDRHQSGAVWVILSSSQQRRSLLGPRLNVSAATDYVISGTASYGWFGYNTLAVTNSGKGRHLVVGEPYARDCRQADCRMDDADIQGIGRLHVYDFSGCTAATSASFVPARVAFVVGTQEFETFGSNFAAGNFGADGRFVLAVSSPRKNVAGKLLFGATSWVQSGEVNVYAFDDILAAVNGSKTTDLSPFATLQGDRHGARFGERILQSAWQRETHCWYLRRFARKTPPASTALVETKAFSTCTRTSPLVIQHCHTAR